MLFGSQECKKQLGCSLPSTVKYTTRHSTVQHLLYMRASSGKLRYVYLLIKIVYDCIFISTENVLMYIWYLLKTNKVHVLL